ncbi:hypothetical protein GCM10018966_055420 [Streptomyces yanii]
MRTRLVTRAAQPAVPGSRGADLRRVVRVVQEDQDAAAVERGAVQRRPFVQGIGDRRVGGPQGAQERAEHRLRLRRPCAGALQVDVELAVREMRARLVGDVHGERRLADAADARERRHGHDRTLRRRQPVAQFTHEGGAAGEVRYGRRELGRADGCRRGCGLVGRVGQFLVGLQDPLLELRELGTRVDAQLVGEQPARVGVHRERFRLTAAAVQGDHQQFAQPLPQRVCRGERGEFGDRLRVAADLQIQVEPGLGELEPPLGEPGALVLGVGARDGGQRFAVPQRQRLVEQGAGPAPVPARPRLLRVGGQLLGRREVERVGPGPYGVSAGVADQRGRVEDLAQPGRVRPYGGERL